MNYKGCLWMETCMNFEENFISDCCVNHANDKGRPILISDYHGEMIDWDKLLDVKIKRIETQKNIGVEECEQCFHLDNYEYKMDRKISSFHFSHCRSCNARCIYCSDDYCSGEINYDTYPVIVDLMEKGHYKPGGEAIFQGGEPTLMQHFDELVDLFNQKGTYVRVLTSGIQYSQKVAEALAKNNCMVVISLDSGCRETYKKVKQVDRFDTVCRTIKKYVDAAKNSKPTSVTIKYVIIPGINDSIKEIDKFFKLIKQLKIKSLSLDIECTYARQDNNKNVSPHIYLLYDYFEHIANKRKLPFTKYAFLPYVLQNRNINPMPWAMKFKPLYNMYVNKYNQKEKNIVYLQKELLYRQNKTLYNLYLQNK